jgi:hypothetical protein
MVSKKILDAVLGLNIRQFEIVGNDIIYQVFEMSKDEKINIYELAHKCKEWAVMLQPNKQALSSYPRWGNHKDYPETNGHYYICQHLVTGVQFEAETEPEAIFKACEWILDNCLKISFN